MYNRQQELTEELFMELLKNTCYGKIHAPKCSECSAKSFCDILYEEVCKYSDEEPLELQDESEVK